MEIPTIVSGIVIVVGLAYLWLNLRGVLIFEYERGLLYRQGRFTRILDPGKHWIFRPIHTVQKIDIRARAVTIPGQEVLSADNVTIKVSLAVSFKVDDPYKAVNATANYLEALYLLLQVQLRDLVGTTPIDELLAKRREIGSQLLESAKAQATEIGLALLSVDLKDIMFPGELKNIFAQVVNARNEGLAALERARGESASLRNLANAAQLLEKNPALRELRILQALGSSSGNTLVLKLTDEEHT